MIRSLRPSKRRRGRPRNRWIDEIIARAGKECRWKARDRKKWSELEEAYSLMGFQQQNKVAILRKISL